MKLLQKSINLLRNQVIMMLRGGMVIFWFIVAWDYRKYGGAGLGKPLWVPGGRKT